MSDSSHFSKPFVSLVNCPVCAASHLPLKKSLTNGVYGCTCENCGHFFKFKAIHDFKSTVTFKINNISYTVGNEFNPATSLNEYMRMTGVSVGTKGCCYEGGCGVCLVTVKLFEPISGQTVEYAINSCCLQLYTCDGLEITTIEGLGDPRVGLHPIQDKMVQHDGAQCGFCTPGQIMNMYGLLKRFPQPTVQQIEDEFDATLCRCTGYRAILDAMKSFAVDAPRELKGKLIDIEELDGKLCKKSGKACVGHCKTKDGQKCENQIQRPIHIIGDVAQWFKPTNLQDLVQLLAQHKTENYRLVFGNTAFGVYQEFGPWNFSVLIDIRGVKELYTIQRGTSLVLGANLSLSNLQELFAQSESDATLPYAATFAKHLQYVAHHGIRNMANWAGNLVMKHAHPEFPSDIFALFETVGAKLSITDSNGTQAQYSLVDFLSLDLKGKVITSVNLPKFTSTGVRVQTYKPSHRLQASQGYVSAGFMVDVVTSQNFLIQTKPSIVIQGVNSQLTHAVQTEAFLLNKQLGDPTVLKNALSLLSTELVPESRPNWSSATFRKSLALSLFYKFVLNVCQSKVNQRYTSGATGLVRTPIVGTQDYGTDPSEYPVSKPMPKITAPYLTSGKVAFLDDLPPVPGQLFASPVLSTVGNAEIDSMDPSIALTLPGVKAFIKASDIPKGGSNDWRPQGIPFVKGHQELLSTGPVLYAGQPLGIIVADTETMAQTGASLVQVTYKNVKPVIVDVEQAVQQKSFFPNPPPPTQVGDPKGAIASAPHKISGSIRCGDQFHFYLETQTSVCTPSDIGGMKVKASTQWLDGVGMAVAQILGLPQSSVEVTTERLGGGFGGKITQNFLVSGLCALAAYVVGKPVKMHLDIHRNMQLAGKREAYFADYQVGFDDNGTLLGVIVTVYADEGIILAESDGGDLLTWIDNAYYCPNWLFSPIAVKTHKPTSTACRSPGSTPALFIIESIMDHVAKSLGKDPFSVRKQNLYVKGQKTPTGMPLNYCTIRNVVSQFEVDINIAQRQQAVNQFNQANRWKKRGLAVMPNRFGIGWTGANYNTHVIIYHGDGSVAIAHGGIDMGQGINTKVTQVCAYEFGIPMDKIKVQTSSSIINANSITSGGSITSELCCMGVIEACTILKNRMAPVKASMVNPTWEQLVQQCYEKGIDLTASYMTSPTDQYASRYNCYSVACVEAELDVLTGQYQLRQMDMLYDAGISMNPELDIGQAEGGFIMGMGYFLQEGMKFDPTTGKALNDGTWEYKIPLAKDLPMNFNFKFIRNAPNPLGVLRSKAVGEPPLTMGAAALLAIKHAVEAARSEVNQDSFFALSAPATPDVVQGYCLNDINNFTFGN
ncbi:uncharacterized protein LOC106056807 [Biomphalaria glabrata]|uniref:Uncharacterized protein LOC106056807 n=1 Tax=Biomphalaria glabrata TaxID=6526 RepID=A0A9W3BNV0_BIOGL|nr:uncharacterized protein LOC106056807 [Biomphalaria glabrata]